MVGNDGQQSKFLGKGSAWVWRVVKAKITRRMLNCDLKVFANFFIKKAIVVSISLKIEFYNTKTY